MRDSFVFYRSFAEGIKCLEPEDQLKALWDVINYALDDDEPEQDGLAQAIFNMAKPQIDKNNKRYQNGCKGGRPTNKSKAEMAESEKARHNTDYLKWRGKVYERDDYKCVCCGSDDDIQAHHIKGFDEYPELRYEVSNGVTLCRNCHNLVHNGNNQEKTKINQVITKIKPKKTKNKPNDNDNDNDIKESTLKGTKEKQEQAFEDFWKIYPKKKSKGQAKRAWEKLNPSSKIIRAIMDKIPQLADSEDWKKDNGQYIPYPATWLNAAGWEDEIGKTSPKTKFDNFENHSYDIDDLTRKLVQM